MIKVSLMS